MQIFKGAQCGALAARTRCLGLLPLLFLLHTGKLPAQAALDGPNQAVVRLMQGGAEAMHQGKTGEAVQYFEQAIAAAPELPDAYLGLGMSELRGGNPKDAEKSLAKAIQLNPKAQGAHLFLGIAQYQLHELEASITSLQQELAAQPQNVEVLTWLGIVELGAGHPDQATGPLDRAAELNPKDPNVLDYRGRAHSLVAQESYRMLTALDPDSWRVHRALGKIASEAMQWENAVAEYRKAIEKQSANADLYEDLGEAYQRLSRFDEAGKAYQSELQISPNNPIALYNLGKILVQQGEARSGVAFLRKAAENSAPSAPLYFYLGQGLAATGHPEEAINWLEKSLGLEPSVFIRQNVYFQLTRVYKALNRNDDAQRAAGELKKLKESAVHPDPALAETP